MKADLPLTVALRTWIAKKFSSGQPTLVAITLPKPAVVDRIACCNCQFEKKMREIPSFDPFRHAMGDSSPSPPTRHANTTASTSTTSAAASRPNGTLSCRRGRRIIYR